MATVQIVTDSTCALPPGVAPAVRDHVRVVRSTVQFGRETWLEGTFALDAFYQRARQGHEHPHSSQPAPGEFLEAFGAAAPHGPTLGIFLSGALSGTFATGTALASEVPNADIHCFDSQLFSAGLGYMVAEATEGALAGHSRDQILERLRWRRERTAIFIAVDTLAWLRRSGRVNLLQASLAVTLDLKPILGVRDGQLVVVRRVRSRRRSLEALVELAAAHAATLPGPTWVAAMHGDAPEAAAQVLAAMQQRLPVTRAFLSEAPASIALHGGPGVVGVTVTAGEGIFDF